MGATPGDQPADLNRLENATQNTTLKTLGTLCRALGFSVGELFDGNIRLSGRSTISKRKR